jgi:hypothetical protein
MQLEKQNKRSCLGLLALLALIVAAVTWMSLGGVPEESTADDVRGPVDAVPPPRGPATPGAGPNPAPARVPG